MTSAAQLIVHLYAQATDAPRSHRALRSVLVACVVAACGGDATSGNGAVQGASAGTAGPPVSSAGGAAGSAGAPPLTAAGSGASGQAAVAGSVASVMAGASGAAGSAGAQAQAGQSGGSAAGSGSGSGGSDASTTGSTADYRDPGTGEWQQGTPDECGMDPSAFDDANVGIYAVFRHGKLCHLKGGTATGMMYSATKTLGGVMAGRAAYLTKDIAKTGPGTGPLLPEDLGTDWISSPSYPRRDATLSHIMSMVAAASASLDDAALRWRYDTVGSEAINNMIPATEKCIAQLPAAPSDAVAFVRQEIFEKLGMPASTWGGGAIATGWSANLLDMGKLGTLLVHDGWYGGEQLVGRDWVYRMSHPNFESATTSYGHLSWLNHRGNAEGIGGNISSGSNAPEGDPCAPAAFWPTYPHGASEAPDCLPLKGGPAVCKQQYDVGVFSAQGLGGQFIVMHPGLDLVIAARNFSGGDGPLGLWKAVRPGLVAKDPMFKGDEAAFCAAYGAGDYAPDLVLSRQP